MCVRVCEWRWWCLREEVSQMTEMGLWLCDNDVCVPCLQMTVQRVYLIGFFPFR